MVERSRVRIASSLLFAPFLLILAPSAGRAQIRRDDCSSRVPPSIGVSAGRSSPSFDLARDAREPGENGSVLVRAGALLAGRADAPISGPWRARIEGSAANWRVERRTYGPHGEVTASQTAGHVEVRQLTAFVGRQGGRTPVCGYVLAGGGLYSLRYQGASIRSPGVALTAGVEVPTGERGAVQADVQLHLINTRSRYPVASTDALAASLSVGWSYRF